MRSTYQTMTPSTLPPKLQYQLHPSAATQVYPMVQYAIDDVFGDSRPGSTDGVPSFLPPSMQWDPVGGTCSGECTPGAHFATPIDASQVFDGTWHTVTMNPNEPVTTITMSFTGKQVCSHNIYAHLVLLQVPVYRCIASYHRFLVKA